LYPLQPNLHGIPIDALGIIPEQLEKTVQQIGKPIKFIYTIPTGQNPTSATLTLERKKQIYQIACQYDFLILEDDPYYYLTFGKEKAFETSFLSMDTEGRVLRFDSMSKVLGGGLRVGWCTGPSELVRQIHLHMQATALSGSGLAQVAVAKLLKHTWGMKGLEEHAKYVQELYQTKRDDLIACIEKYLKGYVEYSVPEAGMFIWMKLLDVPDSKPFVMEHLMARNVCLVPGEAFSPNREQSAYVRAAFSLESKENMEM
jgi:kynurenine/2-aminoadipate aminotransferase